MELPVYTAVGICQVFMLTGCWQDRDGTPCIYSSWYVSCVYVDCLLAGSGMELPVYTAVGMCHAFMLTGCWQDPVAVMTGDDP